MKLRRFSRAVGVAIVATVSSSFVLRAAPSPERKQSPEAEIRQALAEWVDANNRGDRARAARIWAPGVEGWFPQAPEFRNEAAFTDSAQAAAERSTRSTFALKIEEVIVSGDLAVVRDVWRETLLRQSGTPVAERTIRSFEVWRPQPDGHWRISRWISAPERWERAR